MYFWDYDQMEQRIFITKLGRFFVSIDFFKNLNFVIVNIWKSLCIGKLLFKRKLARLTGIQVDSLEELELEGTSFKSSLQSTHQVHQP